MARIVLVSGKGGVGKTTVAAATGLASARQGHRTIVLSFDLAHSLSDSFDLDRGLFDQNKGLPSRVAENLDIQEVDVQEEMERHWKDVYQYAATLLTSTGLDDVVAEEVAILPGMEDVISLLHINRYVTENAYDVIVVDCPPTGDSLRFVNITSTLDWYMRKRFKMDRQLLKLTRPLAQKLTSYELPDDGYFSSLEKLFKGLDGVDAMLTDPKVTTVRLVTNAEKMVVRETQRAHMYFSLYGMVTDAVVVNRLISPTAGYLPEWAQAQAGYAAEIEEYFQPVPTFKVPFFEREVLGLDRLGEVADAVYGSSDPAQFYLSKPPYSFEKGEGGSYQLKLDLPFVDKGDIQLSRHDGQLIIRIGSFKRHVPLPRHVSRLPATDARKVEGQLTVSFKEATP